MLHNARQSQRAVRAQHALCMVHRLATPVQQAPSGRPLPPTPASRSQLPDPAPPPRSCMGQAARGAGGVRHAMQVPYTGGGRDMPGHAKMSAGRKREDVLLARECTGYDMHLPLTACRPEAMPSLLAPPQPPARRGPRPPPRPLLLPCCLQLSLHLALGPNHLWPQRRQPRVLSA